MILPYFPVLKAQDMRHSHLYREVCQLGQVRCKMQTQEVPLGSLWGEIRRRVVGSLRWAKLLDCKTGMLVIARGLKEDAALSVVASCWMYSERNVLGIGNPSVKTCPKPTQYVSTSPTTTVLTLEPKRGDARRSAAGHAVPDSKHNKHP